MNKQEKAIVVLLFALLLGWFFHQDKVTRERAETLRREREREAMLAPVAEATDETAVQDDRPVPARPDDAVDPVPDREDEETVRTAEQEAEPLLPERIEVLANEVMNVEISSWGGVITGVELKLYPQTLDPESDPIRFDFSDRPALAIGNIAGLSARNDFTLSVDGPTATAERDLGTGLRYVRTLTLTDGYQILVSESFRNDGDIPLSLPEHTLGSGFMESIQTKAKSRGQSFLELNALGYRTGSHVKRWREKDFSKMLGAPSSGIGCAPANMELVDETGMDLHHELLAWGAAKNRFFVQIIAPEEGAAGCRLHAARDPEAETLDVTAVALDMIFPAMILEPGVAIRRETGYYIGPNKYSKLQALGKHQDKAMLHAWQRWGWFRTLSVGMLWTLNRIYDVIPNYGVAIILMTILVRIVFWPITRKSTSDMRKMQDLKPLMAKIKEKHKENPKRMQEETWALYRKHKVNPMTSCLPMLVQMPVFVALFNVLRGAVELRFAPFLWIADLSEPERLLEGILPFGLVLNILPLLMTATTFFQQKLTPTGGDPAQQRMMMFMPLFMLFIFYNFPAALALYWTVSQGLAIVQMLGKRRQTSA